MNERIDNQTAPNPEGPAGPEDPRLAGQAPFMGEGAGQQPPTAEAAPQEDPETQNRLAHIRGMVKEAVAWTAPVVGTAIKDETGMDPFRFTKEGQPELTSDQNFAAGMARFALRRGMERLAARASYAA
jgi:hypothetical protein